MSLAKHLAEIESKGRQIKARRCGCDHCESVADEFMRIIEQAREDVRPIIEAEAEGERQAPAIMGTQSTRDELFLSFRAGFERGKREGFAEGARECLKLAKTERDDFDEDSECWCASDAIVAEIERVLAPLVSAPPVEEKTSE